MDILDFAKECGAKEYGPLTWNLTFTRSAWVYFEQAFRGLELRCDGCGSKKTIDQIKISHPDALSCCPERKMVVAVREQATD